MILLFIVILLFILYSILIIYYWRSWNSVPDFILPDKTPTATISVIIPARNERENIGRLLQALQEQSYPEYFFEVIVVDDHSTDDTAGIVKQFSTVKLMQLKETGINSYKKKAIEVGIAAATGDVIITTDADCVPSADWLKLIAAFKEEKNAVFVAAPVAIENNSSILQIFQALDFLTLQGITAAAVYKRFHNMCNGANLAYEKKAFYKVNGFAGIDKIASGDDLLLMNKIAEQYPEKIFYLKSKDAVVSTKPMKTWKEFFYQRIRWASKAPGYKDKRIIFALLLVYFFNLSFLGLLFAGWWLPVLWIWILVLLLLKTIIEFSFVWSVARFFNKEKLMWVFPLFQPLHILYTIAAGFAGSFGSYEWKGRKVK